MKYTVTMTVDAPDEETAASLIKNEVTMLGIEHVMPVYPERLLTLRAELREIGDELQTLYARVQEIASEYEDVPAVIQFLDTIYAAFEESDGCDFELEITEEMAAAVQQMEEVLVGA